MSDSTAAIHSKTTTTLTPSIRSVYAARSCCYSNSWQSPRGCRYNRATGGSRERTVASLRPGTTAASTFGELVVDCHCYSCSFAVCNCCRGRDCRPEWTRRHFSTQGNDTFSWRLMPLPLPRSRFASSNSERSHGTSDIQLAASQPASQLASYPSLLNANIHTSIEP